MTANNELRKRIAEADDMYWTYGISIMPDEEYDGLKESLHDAEKFGTPTVKSFGKVTHPRPMLSMQKVYDPCKIFSWANNFHYLTPIRIMPKYDGVALVIYPDGTVATRGDGTTGEDVTLTTKYMGHEIQEKCATYGEAVMSFENFNALKDEYGYKTPRNAVSGILNADRSDIRDLIRFIQFIPYTLYSTSTLSFELPTRLRICQNNLKDVMDTYPCDGIVFRIADDALFDKLGHTDHHWRGQIALKFANKSADTVLERIDWQVKNGTVTPVGILKPVELDGVTVLRVTLHNWRKVRDSDIRPGDQVRIERAGGVVPKFISNARTANSESVATQWPLNCPICGGVLSTCMARLFCSKCEGNC